MRSASRDTLKDFVIRAIAKATEEDIPAAPIHSMAALTVSKSKGKKKA